MTDKLRPSNATSQGQFISLAEGLRTFRGGKVLAWIWLLAMLAVGVFLAWAVFIAS